MQENKIIIENNEFVFEATNILHFPQNFEITNPSIEYKSSSVFQSLQLWTAFRIAWSNLSKNLIFSILKYGRDDFFSYNKTSSFHLSLRRPILRIGLNHSLYRTTLKLVWNNLFTSSTSIISNVDLLPSKSNYIIQFLIFLILLFNIGCNSLSILLLYLSR